MGGASENAAEEVVGQDTAAKVPVAQDTFKIIDGPLGCYDDDFLPDAYLSGHNNPDLAAAPAVLSTAALPTIQGEGGKAVIQELWPKERKYSVLRYESGGKQRLYVRFPLVSEAEDEIVS